MNEMEHLLSSTVFFAFVTDSYIQDAKCLAQLKAAVDAGKPIFLALDEGVKIPDGYLDGAALIETVTFSLSNFHGEKIKEVADKLAEFVKKIKDDDDESDLGSISFS